MSLVVGVDGCHRRWLCIARTISRDGLVADVRDVLDLAALADVSTVDVPIGLPENKDPACDKAARRLLGGREPASSLSKYAPPWAQPSMTGRPIG
ncbi:MAG: DUF429 domain-containing protein [Clostridia bacterium]|nr:DUF429 domain-containing protein [Deltaproteobacteria bacterium]